MPSSLDATLNNPDTLILTPNRRLLRHMTKRWQQQTSDDVRKTPKLYALDDWLLETWLQALDASALAFPAVWLNRQQEMGLWSQVLEQNGTIDHLINPVSLAQDVAGAYRTLKQWNLTLSDIQESNPHTERLQTWIADFESTTQQRGLVTREQAIEQLIECRAIRPQAQVILYGFDDIPPQITRLIHSFSDDLITRDAEHHAPQSTSVIQPCQSHEGEILASAQWAKSQIEQSCAQRIGIIVPDLGQRRSLVERIFSEVFEPAHCLPEIARFTLPFNFSAGQPLGAMPVIADALQLLKLNFQTQPIDKLIGLLNSPFWLAADYPMVAAWLCQQLRQTHRTQCRTAFLRRLLEHWPQKTDDSDQSEAFSTALAALETSRRSFPAKATPSAWAARFSKQLHLLHWPGQRRPDSQEYQQLTQWYELLEHFSGLDITHGPLSLSEAIEALQSAAQQRHFQAQTPDSPIQILGILEGAGLPFDACWVLGMSELQWPPSPAPNPLLPISLQRQYKMPHADADREMAFASRLTRQYLHCAPTMTFSFVQQQEGMPVNVSPLIGDLGLEHNPMIADQNSAWQNHLQQLHKSQSLDWCTIEQAPAIDHEAARTLKGGSGIFTEQSRYPLAAFIKYRLQAAPPHQPQVGLTPLQRGVLIHDGLADFWQQVKTHQALSELSSDQLSDLLETHVGSALHRLTRKEPQPLGQRYLALETKRALQLLSTWLETERKRTPFSVSAIEESLHIAYQGIPLNVRLDRVDRLQNGSLLLIDYKTGAPSVNHWSGARPKDPQLPLYLLAYHQTADAIAFATISAKSIKLAGVGSDHCDFDGKCSEKELQRAGLPTDWELNRQQWQQTLEHLANEFLRGCTTNTLFHPSLIRQYDYLRGLLRIDEHNELAELNPEEISS